MAEIKKTGVQAPVRQEKTPRYSSQSLGGSGQHAGVVAETSTNSQNGSRDEDQLTTPHEHGGLAMACEAFSLAG